MAKASEATLQARNDAAHLRGQIDKLADWIASNVAGEPSQDESAVDTAIRLMRMPASGNAELENANNALGEQLQQALARVKQLSGELIGAMSAKTNAEKAEAATMNDNNALRDQLHQITVEKARLEGQLERVHEFDPITDRRLYSDGVSSIERFQRRNYRDGDAPTSRDVAGWYRRG